MANETSEKVQAGEQRQLEYLERIRLKREMLLEELARLEGKKPEAWHIWYQRAGGAWQRLFLGRRDDTETRFDDLMEGEPSPGVLVVAPVDFDPTTYVRGVADV